MQNLKEYFESGMPIIIHDGGERENEADLVFYAGGVTPSSISMLREKAGGLICLAVSSGIAERLGLQYLRNIYSANPGTKELVIGKAPYGDESAFSISINHRGTYTGITDKDRALTIREFFGMAEKGETAEFRRRFYVPGHVHLLIARKSLKERKGHTEMSVFFAEKMGLRGMAVLCEMLDGETGDALSFEKTKEFADRNGIPMFHKKEIEALLG